MRIPRHLREATSGRSSIDRGKKASSTGFGSSTNKNAKYDFSGCCCSCVDDDHVSTSTSAAANAVDDDVVEKIDDNVFYCW